MRLKGKITIVTLIFTMVYVLLSVFSVDLDNISFQHEPTSKTTTVIHESVSGNIEVYFCPRQRCEDALIDFLETAHSSIHCAFYDLDLENLTSTLEEKSLEIDVDVVIDEDNEDEYNASFVSVNDAYGLMHHKFCIVDGQRISTGSFNPTIRGAYLNNNNLLFIDSNMLATNYLQDFEEVKKNEKRSNSSTMTHLRIGEVDVENYFCPEDNCAEAVLSELREAKESIYFMTFSFTHDQIATVLAIKKDAGLDIRGVMESRQVTKYSQFDFLDFQGVAVSRDGNKGNMHHKVFIIDNRTVITGSFNPSQNADTRNDENILIVHDSEVADKYLQEFERIWIEAN